MTIITLGGKRLVIGKQVMQIGENDEPTFDWKTNLIGYFKFDGNLNNEHGDLSFIGDSPVFDVGKNGGAFRINTIIEGNKHKYTNKISFGFWYKSNDSAYVLSFTDSIYISDKSISMYNKNFYTNYTDWGIYDGEWHHFFFVLSGIMLTVYRDGVALYTNTIGSPLDSYEMSINIPQIVTSNFIIDELAVWDGRIITPDEVTQLYNCGNGLFI